MPRQTISKLSAGDLSTLSKGTGVLVSYNIAINNSFIIHVLFGAEMLDGPINFMIFSVLLVYLSHLSFIASSNNETYYIFYLTNSSANVQT